MIHTVNHTYIMHMHTVNHILYSYAIVSPSDKIWGGGGGGSTTSEWGPHYVAREV